ncbi:MAG: hypothetical protein LBD79_03465 [Treponema sp.]|nr:hypothetical protein [Treponema sp.]
MANVASLPLTAPASLAPTSLTPPSDTDTPSGEERLPCAGKSGFPVRGRAASLCGEERLPDRELFSVTNLNGEERLPDRELFSVTNLNGSPIQKPYSLPHEELWYILHS